MTRERLGEVFVLASTILWGIFPIVTQIIYRGMAPLPALAWAELFASAFFAIILTSKRQWKAVANREAFMDILWATAILGIVYYLLTFIGLKYTSAGNASLIGLTEIFFSYLFFNIFRGEKMPRMHLVGAICMVAGAAIVLYPNAATPKLGDFLIVLAAGVAPFGNFFQRRARRHVPSESIMFVRSIISAIFIFGLSFAIGQNTVMPTSWMIIALLALNGIFLLGLSKIFWIEGIYRINVMKANGLQSATPLFTLIFAYMILGNSPTAWQLAALIPMAAGVILLGRTYRVPNQEALSSPS